MKKGFFAPQEMNRKIIDVAADAMRNNNFHFGLFFDKYVLWWYDDKENRWECNPKVQISLLRRIWRNPQEAKRLLENPNIMGRKFRESIIKDVKGIPFDAFPLEEYKIYKNKMDQLLVTLEDMGFCVKYLPEERSGISLNWRLIIDLGAASVYETSLLFHRNYSIPYIPGSAVKGVARHWAIQKFAEKAQELERISYEDAIEKVSRALEHVENLRIEVNKLKFEELIEIFGTQNRKGKVIFFDGLPVIENPDKNFIVLNVMNVHYKPYYERGETPGDWHKPTPIFFLAVEKGTEFRFALASKEKSLVEKAIELLREALENMGIGAKTSAGYGYFDVCLRCEP